MVMILLMLYLVLWVPYIVMAKGDQVYNLHIDIKLTHLLIAMNYIAPYQRFVWLWNLLGYEQGRGG